MPSTPTAKSPLVDLENTTRRLRNRAWLLRLQAYIALGLILLVGYALILLFSNHTALTYEKTRTLLQSDTSSARDPYDYRLMEQRHNALISKLGELSEELEVVRDEMRVEKYGKDRERQQSLTSLEARLSDLRATKLAIEDRLSKDRANLMLEINKLKDERDQANRDGVDRKIIVSLVSDFAFRAGALILAIYLSSLLFSTSKYLLRVADHLNSVADSVDLSATSGLSIECAVKALTPHSIDFHLDDSVTLKSLRDYIALFKDSAKSTGKGET